MKIVLSKNAKWFGGIVVGLCVLTAALLNVAGYFTNNKYISVLAAVAEANKYEVRSTLLTEAMDYVGACNPEKAADIWAMGLKSRSAAMQYSVMSKELKTEYARQLEKSAKNWVTGISSPWVENYKVIKEETSSEDCRSFELRFSLATSTGPAGEYNAVLTVCRQDDFWRITKISADPALYPYTRFKT